MLLHDEWGGYRIFGGDGQQYEGASHGDDALGAEVAMTTCMRMIAVSLRGACCNKHHSPLFRRLA